MNATLIIITLLSVALAATASLLAWRVVRDERRRSDARVAALAAAAGGDAPESTGLFEQPASFRHRWSVGVLAAGAGLISLFAFLMLPRASQPSVAHDTEPPLAASSSLQLVALDAIRSGDNLIVRGNVRNPAGAAVVAPVSVVVVGIGDNGQTLARAQGDLEPADLPPGEEAMFSVTMTDAADIARYRVGFRVKDRVVPHVDDRE